MSVRHLLIIAVTSCVLISGCGTETRASNPFLPHRATIIRDDAPDDELALVSVEPALPAALAVSEKLRFDIVYELKSIEQAAIGVRPFVNSQRANGYHAHHLIIVSKDTENPGIITGWFYFDKPTQINEVRLYMQNLDTGATVKELSYPISAAWTNP
jgi:hypothetical protein